MGLWGVTRRWRESAVCGVGDGVGDGMRVADALLWCGRRKGDSLYVRCQCALLHSCPSNFLLDDFA